MSFILVQFVNGHCVLVGIANIYHAHTQKPSCRTYLKLNTKSAVLRYVHKASRVSIQSTEQVFCRIWRSGNGISTWYRVNVLANLILIGSKKPSVVFTQHILHPTISDCLVARSRVNTPSDFFQLVRTNDVFVSRPSKLPNLPLRA